MQAQTRPPSRVWVLLPLAMAFAIIIGIGVYGLLAPPKVKPAPAAPGFRGSLVWGDGIFSNKEQLKAWLGLHGASYRAWVKQHPAALRLVKPPAKQRVSRARAAVRHKPAVRRVVPSKAAAAPRVVRHATPAAAPPATPAPTGSSSQSVIWLIVLVIWLAGLAWLLAGVIRRRVGPRRRTLLGHAKSASD